MIIRGFGLLVLVILISRLEAQDILQGHLTLVLQGFLMTVFSQSVIEGILLIQLSLTVLLLVWGAYNWVYCQLLGRLQGRRWQVEVLMFGLLLAGLAILMLGLRFPPTQKLFQFGGSLLVLSFWSFLYTLAWSRLKSRLQQADNQAVIVLGAGLIHGNQVGPLLQGRIRAGVKAAQGRPGVPIVMSGGQGPDEDLPEGHAMKAYLEANYSIDHPILVEDESINTYQNIESSLSVLEKAGYEVHSVAIASNSWHLLRALNYAGELGLEAQGFASRTPWRQRPYNYFREWLAVVYSNQTAFIALFLLVAAGFLLWS